MDKSNSITGVVNDASVSNIQDKILTGILNPILALATTVSFALFVWGMIRFLISRTTNPDEVSKGKTHMIYGVISLVILLSIWSILILIGKTFESNIWFVK